MGIDSDRLAKPANPPGRGNRRTLGKLWQSARAYREERLRNEAEEKERERLEQEAKRKAHLESLLERADTLWREVDSLVERKTSSAYDQAVAELKDLCDAYAQAGRAALFQKRLRELTDRNTRHPGLMSRIAKSQLTSPPAPGADFRLEAPTGR
jgi:transketolase